MPAARRARSLPLRTAAVYVAFGTGVSRVTGLLRFVALAWALGQTFLADSYNLANTTPNMLYDVVLGGVLSATFIPVFVDRLSNKSEPEAFESISAVVSVSVVVLFTTTVAALIAAPYIIDALTALDKHATAAQVHRVALERGVATTLLRWFVIQIAAYGLFALAAALLNTRRRFVAVAWAPIVNNIVCISILVWFGLWAGHGASLASVEQHRTQLILLGL
ncbi:MAG TPA: lipid II flippase MurJ, partial [Acidimicrobiales bacterium]|nr:lipid II flippase MurJ [Acidimicrobiales bacterium]